MMYYDKHLHARATDNAKKRWQKRNEWRYFRHDWLAIEKEEKQQDVHRLFADHQYPYGDNHVFRRVEAHVPDFFCFF